MLLLLFINSDKIFTPADTLIVGSLMHNTGAQYRRGAICIQHQFYDVFSMLQKLPSMPKCHLCTVYMTLRHACIINDTFSTGQRFDCMVCSDNARYS